MWQHLTCCLVRVRRLGLSSMRGRREDPKGAGVTSPMREPGAYCNPRFAAASRLVSRIAVPGQCAASRATLALHLDELRALKELWADLPRLEAGICEDSAAAFAADLRASCELPVLGREPLAVLTTRPKASADHSTERERAFQANLGRAIALGCRAAPVPCHRERAHWNLRATRVRSPVGPTEHASSSTSDDIDRLAVVGLDGSDRPVSSARARRFGSWAVVDSTGHGAATESASLSRFVVHAALVGRLRALGVEYLVAGAAFRAAPPLQLHQHLLGYEPAHVRVSLVRGRSRRLPLGLG